jgi:hypothetical protein
VVSQHKILPEGESVIILMDEVLRFMSNARAVAAGDSNMATQFYNFLSSLQGAVSKRRGASLVTSLPKSIAEMTSEDEGDFTRLRHLLGRKDLPIILAEGPYYRYTPVPGLNKLLADRRAIVSSESVEEKVREVIHSSFGSGPKIFQRYYFPEESSDIPDSTMLNLIVMPPDQTWEPGIRERTRERVETFIKEYGSRTRIYKNALFFTIPQSSRELEIKSRDFLAAEVVKGEAEPLHLTEEQKEIADEV